MVAQATKPAMTRKDENQNETLISQSMQLSDDEEEDGVTGAHETSISYLTRDNLQQQQSNKKFGSNVTRKTT